MGHGPGDAALGAGELRQALGSPDPALRAAALDRARPGPGVEEILVGALRDHSPEVRRAAARAIGRVDGPVATRALMEQLSGDLSVRVRLEAVAAIGRILSERVRDGNEPGGLEAQDPDPTT
jgi:HEAT repeat protein